MSNQSPFRPMGSPGPTVAGLERTADIDPRLTRTHYFEGRLLSAEDLTRDQLYLDRRLREAGEVLGNGVLRGLGVSLDRNAFTLTITPGEDPDETGVTGVGITAAGRVLTLTRTLTVELGDRATIAGLNQGQHRRLERGLYAVVLRYAEVGTDVAEVFPRDLGPERDAQHNVITEAVEPALVPLPRPLPEQSELAVRALLARELAGDAAGIVPEDAVALGVLAVSDDVPRWLDSQLLRHPPRQSPDEQADLLRHYRALLADVLAQRRAGSLGTDFTAADYFHVLPPAGPLPKGALDPAGGRQGFFPESFRVSVTPVRRADLKLIQAESMALPPIDLAADPDIEVMVLAPLDARDYGHYARQLERDFDPAVRALPHPDPLRLRLYPRSPVHRIDTDETTWRAIWERVDEEAIVYVRRPVRPAETAVSGIVLARGTTVPEPAGGDGEGGPSPGDGDTAAVDEDQVLLNRINLAFLARLREPADEAGREAFQALRERVGDDADAVMNCLAVLLRIEPRFDDLAWQTLLGLAGGGTLQDFRQELMDAQAQGMGTAEFVARAGQQFGLGAELTDRWAERVTG